MTTLNDISVTMLDGRATTFGEWSDKVTLVVNVASRCGLAPQYETLEALQQQYSGSGFTVLGVPSNQFLQELGSSEKIAEYCSTTWGVSFPMTEKVAVNGRNQHPLYAELVKAEDDQGKAGKVKWNFEKFLVMPSGEIMRFRPTTLPDDPKIIAAIEANLPSTASEVNE
ncbi:glutathione peroxidase [Humidisolicoccus flavus]|uniref:glutathione peroxidase n=1 Tax=Humidisolicoccus flavus TaxID=3111414 RepID=UPI003251A9DB